MYTVGQAWQVKWESQGAGCGIMFSMNSGELMRNMTSKVGERCVAPTTATWQSHSRSKACHLPSSSPLGCHTGHGSALEHHAA